MTKFVLNNDEYDDNFKLAQHWRQIRLNKWQQISKFTFHLALSSKKNNIGVIASFVIFQCSLILLLYTNGLL